MTERKEYSSMSPLELNAELRQIYEQIPADQEENESPYSNIEEMLGDLRQTWKMLDRHRRSEHKEMYLNAFTKLRPYIKGSLSFREFVDFNFNRSYDTGID